VDIISNKRSFDELQILANQGNAEAYYILGCMYRDGDVVPVNNEKMLECFINASVLGYADAQCLLGLHYLHRATYDITAATKWLAKAVDQNHAKAQYFLAQFYYGKNDQENLLKAYELFLKSHLNGHPMATFFLGEMYRLGKGVRKDFEKAFVFLNEAGLKGCPQAFSHIGQMYIIIGDNLGERGNGENAKEAFAYQLKAAQLGDLQGTTSVGFYAKEGIGCAKDKEVARYWLTKALSINEFQKWDETIICFDLSHEVRLAGVKKIAQKHLEDLDKGGCFISTATAKCLGWCDDGEELNILRNFRDTWLQQTKKRRKDVQKYYDIAPDIVKGIDSCDNSDQIYQSICTDYLKPVMQAIRTGDYNLAHKVYKRMVAILEKQYIADPNL
jgi:TPR repeat protein